MSRVNLIKPVDGAPEHDFRSRLHTTLEGLFEGRSRAYGSFTLTASSGNSTINDARFESHQSVVWAPLSANAAAAMNNLYCSTRNKGSFVLTHTSTADVDRTFMYIIAG